MFIRYSDPEVGVFHPVCETALRRALAALGRDADYEVTHHMHVKTLEMDFAVRRRATGRCLCVVEVKRTGGDVQSLRYQYQAMSYVQMLGVQLEQPFYILTNLEGLYALRYDAARPEVYRQMLEPGFQAIADFARDDADAVTDKLAAALAGLLDDFLRNRYTYMASLGELYDWMLPGRGNLRAWNTRLAAPAYEYIRGALTAAGRGGTMRGALHCASNTSLLCGEGARAGFGAFYTYDPARFEARFAAPGPVLASMFSLGGRNPSGDAAAGVLYEAASAGGEGEVPTDLELARCAALFLKDTAGALSPGALLFDPCAGSGSLICAAGQALEAEPDALWANDKNGFFAGGLALRLGLQYPLAVGPAAAPRVTGEDVLTLLPADMACVRAVILNPPFVSGIKCKALKAAFAARIEALTGAEAVTNVGQMALEGLFLELVCALLPKGTAVVCVLPCTHLTARGREAAALRRLLLGPFGLQGIFLYPGEKLFSAVTKDTCLFAGVTGTAAPGVKVLRSLSALEDLDLGALERALGSALPAAFADVETGVEGRLASRVELSAGIADGWRVGGRTEEEARAFAAAFDTHPMLMTIGNALYQCERGKTGNSGASDLLYLNDAELAARHAALFHKAPTRPGMRNAKYPSFLVGEGDTRFFDVTGLTDAEIDTVVNDYLTLPARGGTQPRRAKTAAQLRAILKREAENLCPAYSVLIPRGIRRVGRVYLAQRRSAVSTNLFVLTPPSCREAFVVATYMASIFYQLDAELSCKDQDGMRKMEYADIACTHVPRAERLTRVQLRALVSALRRFDGFQDLKAPSAQELDRVWADILYGADGPARLAQAERHLAFLAAMRDR